MRGLRIGVVTAVALFAGFLATAPASAAPLKSRLLSVTDLPTGWTVTYHTGHSKGGGVSSSRCLSGFPKGPTHFKKARISFTQRQTTVLGENIATGHGVLALLHLFNRQVRACHGVTLKNTGKTLHMTIAPMSFPKISPTSNAYALSASEFGFSFGFDVVSFRAGNCVGYLLYGGLGSPDVTTFLAFAKEAVAKAEGKHVSPPSTMPGPSESV
jgi:hypothetical protein